MRQDPRTIRPPDVVTAPVFICTTRPRRSEVITVATCRSCGWCASVPAAGETLDLFAPTEHSADDCTRRQLDPQEARRQDSLLTRATVRSVDEPHGVRVRRGIALPPNTICVASPSDFGNPFDCKRDRLSRQLAVTRHRRWLNGAYPDMRSPGSRRLTGPQVKEAALTELRGWDLACDCALGEPCHRNNYLDLLREAYRGHNAGR